MLKSKWFLITSFYTEIFFVQVDECFCWESITLRCESLLSSRDECKESTACVAYVVASTLRVIIMIYLSPVALCRLTQSWGRIFKARLCFLFTSLWTKCNATSTGGNISNIYSLSHNILFYGQKWCEICDVKLNCHNFLYRSWSFTLGNLHSRHKSRTFETKRSRFWSKQPTLALEHHLFGLAHLSWYVLVFCAQNSFLSGLLLCKTIFFWDG